MKYFIFYVLTFSASILGSATAAFFTIVWNVGQGQWVTTVTPTHCYHFDVGGEFFPWRKISLQCADKKNLLFLSHWDWDHVGALAKPALKKYLPELCIALPPTGKSSERKMRLVSKLRKCATEDFFLRARVWSPQAPADLPALGIEAFEAQGNKRKGQTSNALSSVVQTRDFLFPGDSTDAQEKMWKSLPWVPLTRFLVLGHHGSRTSTSEALLKRLPMVRMSFSSARWSRYKHPHSETVARLQQARIAVLRTEDWGNIWLQQPPLY